MKLKIFTTVLLLLQVTISCFCQNTPYFNQTSKWYWNGGAAGFFQDMYFYHQTEYVEGDTIINSVSYHKIYTDYQDTTTQAGQLISIDSSKHVYTSALREDAGRVYRINGSNSTETLLFDYNVQLGQVLSLPGCGQGLVTDIDTIPFAGSYRYIFFLDSNPYKFIIEGFGSHWGLSVECPSSLAFEGAIYLDCYEMNNDKIGLDNNVCPLPTGIDHPLPSDFTYIYPNPVSETLFIETSTEYSAARIFDITGRLVKETAFSRQLDISRIESGVYILEIGNSVTRIVKQ